MINYLIEFSLIHLLLFGIYKLILRRETQVSFLRIYLLGATLLALIIPLIHLPNYSPVKNFNITGVVSTMVLPEFVVGQTEPEAFYSPLSNIPRFIFLLVSIIMVTRLLTAFIKLSIIYRKSEPHQLYGKNVRYWAGLDSSFTFFKWIFINNKNLQDIKEIIRHEDAHIRYGHSYDLLFMNLLTIPFWWVPSVWLTIRQLKQLHEYQADAYVLSSITPESYIHTLIHHSLKQQGLILTNSFNDTPLTKRLNYMKQLKHNISPWKLTMVFLVLLLTAYTFSCQNLITDDLSTQVEAEKSTNDGPVFQIVDQSPDFNGGIEEFYSYVGNTLKYTDNALKNKVSGKVYVEFVVNKDGSVSDVKVLRGLGYGLDEEAKRVVENSPDWIPGSQKGHIVKVRMVLPITFKNSDSPERNGIQLASPPIKIEGNTDKTPVEVEPENMPKYPGGVTEFFKYVSDNIQYPDEARKLGIEGKVFVQFLINTDGSIDHVKIVKGIDTACDKEAKRIVENSANWIPMVVDGEPRAMTMVLPITFAIPNK